MTFNEGLHSWISKNTENDDVFSIPYPRIEYWIQFAAITKRPVYYANAMAFDDKYLKESNERKNMLYGTWQEWGDAGPIGFYCNLSERRVLEATKKFRLDYLIVNNSCRENNSALISVYKDEEIQVLKIPKIKGNN